MKARLETPAEPDIVLTITQQEARDLRGLAQQIVWTSVSEAKGADKNEESVLESLYEALSVLGLDLGETEFDGALLKFFR